VAASGGSGRGGLEAATEEYGETHCPPDTARRYLVMLLEISAISSLSPMDTSVASVRAVSIASASELREHDHTSPHAFNRQPSKPTNAANQRTNEPTNQRANKPTNQRTNGPTQQRDTERTTHVQHVRPTHRLSDMERTSPASEPTV
jgi:hypothetical protein